MKEVVRQYGAVVIAVTAVLMMFGILMLLPRTKHELPLPASGNRESAMERLMERCVPQISARRLTAGQRCELQNAFAAVDQEGKQIKVTLYQICNEAGEDVTEEVFLEEEECLYFARHGKYTAAVRAEDAQGAWQECRVVVYVDRPTKLP